MVSIFKYKIYNYKYLVNIILIFKNIYNNNNSSNKKLFIVKYNVIQ